MIAHSLLIVLHTIYLDVDNIYNICVTAVRQATDKVDD